MKFCLIYPYATWISVAGKPCGGAEKQMGLLAQHLVRRGHEVTFVTLAYRGPETDIHGVQVRHGWDAGRGVRWLRTATHRIPSLRRVLEDVGADVYYVRGAQLISRWVISVAHQLEAPALLGLASDRNLLPESGRMLVASGHGPVDRATGPLAWLLLQRPALRAADVIVVQNEEQASRCSRMGLPHALVPSIVELPPRDLLDREAEYDVIWAGNVHGSARRRKGVEPLLELVRSLPDARFAVVGGLNDTSLSGILPELRAAANVDLRGLVGYDDVQDLIARSRLVLNTSPMEGFSNVMLEGWALGKPSVTLTVNPSGLLADGHWPSAAGPERPYEGALGACANGDLRVLSLLIRAALADDAAVREVGRRCRGYVAEVHDPDAVCARYEDLAVPPRFTPQHGLPIGDGARSCRREPGPSA